jgi:hypothetical protein
VTTYERNHDASTTNTGALDLYSSDARVSYVASWYDGVGRPVETANYGTQLPIGGRPDTPPAVSSAAALVTKTTYEYSDVNNGGRIEFVVETEMPNAAAGTRTDWTIHDAAGRVIETIQNRVSGPGLGSDANITTRTTYTPGGQISTLTVANTTTGG